jgi:hypothetical protein
MHCTANGGVSLCTEEGFGEFAFVIASVPGRSSVFLSGLYFPSTLSLGCAQTTLGA